MSFRIGQEVVCIEDKFPEGYNHAPLKKDKHYFIKGLRQSCCFIEVDVGFRDGTNMILCSECNTLSPAYGIHWLRADRFAPIESIPESHEIEVTKLIEESKLEKNQN